MTLTGLFPIIIYDTILNPPECVRRHMVEYVDSFYENRKEFYDPPNITGDYHGETNISSRREFFWLNEQLSFHVKKYLEGININHDDLSIFVQKSWPVVCLKDDGQVYKHFHKNSCISAVFYLQLDESDCGGNLIFYPPSNYTHLLIPVSYELQDFYYSTHKPLTNQLIIFPSSLEHEVTKYTGDIKRYSISFDITIVTNNLQHNENYIINPNLWTKI